MAHGRTRTPKCHLSVEPPSNISDLGELIPHSNTHYITSFLGNWQDFFTSLQLPKENFFIKESHSNVEKAFIRMQLYLSVTQSTVSLLRRP